MLRTTLASSLTTSSLKRKNRDIKNSWGKKQDEKTANMYLKIISSHTSSEEYKYIFFFLNNTQNKFVLVKNEIYISLATRHRNMQKAAKSGVRR